MAITRKDFRQRKRGQIDVKDYIGQFTFGCIIAALVWGGEIFIEFLATLVREYKPEGSAWSSEILISPQYLTLPIIIGLIAMFAPSLLFMLAPDLNSERSRRRPWAPFGNHDPVLARIPRSRKQ